MMTPDTDHAAAGDRRMYQLGRRHAKAALEMGYREDVTAAVTHYENRDKPLTSYERGMVETLKARLEQSR